MLRGYLILIRFVAVIMISILASLFLEHTVFVMYFIKHLPLYCTQKSTVNLLPILNNSSAVYEMAARVCTS